MTVCNLGAGASFWVAVAWGCWLSFAALVLVMADRLFLAALVLLASRLVFSSLCCHYRCNLFNVAHFSVSIEKGTDGPNHSDLLTWQYKFEHYYFPV